MNAKLTLFDNLLDCLYPDGRRIAGFLRKTRYKPAFEYGEYDGIEQLLVLTVDGTVHKYVASLLSISRPCTHDNWMRVYAALRLAKTS